MKNLVLTVLLALLVLSTSYINSSEQEQVTSINNVGQGSLVTTGEKGVVITFPLKHTSVKGKISGFISEVTVTQTFENPYDKSIEAVYVFPLPHTAAVNQMTMKIGDRIIKGEIKKREEAKKIYQDAKRQGKTASLLEQERANIFTQSVANIHPGDKIEIIITYFYALPYNNGEYSFEFPMVVGPRYIPGSKPDMITSSDPSFVPQSENKEPSGYGWGKDNNRVPDASRITPTYLKPGFRSGHDIDVEIELDAGMKVENLSSVNHKINQEGIDNSKVKVTLSSDDNIPNKDFIIRYKTAGEALKTACLSTFNDKDGYFMFVLQPKMKYNPDEYVPRDLVFLLDCSGSMSGKPVEQSKAVMREAIANMHPKDRFKIIVFADEPLEMSHDLLDNTKKNREAALAYINAIQGAGGTEMLKGVQKALTLQRNPKRRAFILIMTDGYIGNESEIISATKAMIGDARFFALGVGTSVNKAFLDDVSEAGKGSVEYISLKEDPKKAAEQFYKKIGNPVLMDIEIEAKDINLYGIYPSRVPDLFADEPVVIFGRYSKPASGQIKVKGRIGADKFSQSTLVTLTNSNDNSSLSSIWARNAIRDKDRLLQKGQGDGARLIEEITSIALQYKLMSQYTAFVAVEEQIRRQPNGEIITIPIPVEMPDGVSYDGVFGKDKEDSKEGKGRGYYGGMGGPSGSYTAAPYAKRVAAQEESDGAGSGDDVDEPTCKPVPISQLRQNKTEDKVKIKVNSERLVLNEIDKLIKTNKVDLIKNLKQWVLSVAVPMKGKIKIEITLKTDGSFDVIVKATPNSVIHPKVLKEVEKEVKTWQFPSVQKETKKEFEIDIKSCYK